MQLAFGWLPSNHYSIRKIVLGLRMPFRFEKTCLEFMTISRVRFRPYWAAWNIRCSFCLEYRVKPTDIETELRIYQVMIFCVTIRLRMIFRQLWIRLSFLTKSSRKLKNGRAKPWILLLKIIWCITAHQDIRVAILGVLAIIPISAAGDFLSRIEELKNQGLTETEIAKQWECLRLNIVRRNSWQRTNDVH